MAENKKYIYIGIVVLVLIALGLYLSLRQTNKGLKIPSKTAVDLNEIRAIAPVLSADGNFIYYYDLTEKNLYKYDIAAKSKTALSQNLTDVPLNVNWSPDKSQAILQIQYDKAQFESEKSVFVNSSITDGATALWNYNLSTQKLSLLDTHIYNPASEATINPIWTADSKNIIYYTAPAGNLVMASPDGSSPQILGKGPSADKFYSIISYDSTDKLFYYSSYSNETNLYHVYKLNIATGKNDELFADYQTAWPINATQMVISNETESDIYTLATAQKQKLTVLAPDQKIATSTDGTKIVIVTNDQNNEIFNIINIADQKLSKQVYDKNETGSSYAGVNLDKDNNLFFTNNYQLFEIKN